MPLKTIKTYYVGIHWIGLTEYSQMSTYVPGFQTYFSGFLHCVFCIVLFAFVFAKLATSSIKISYQQHKGYLKLEKYDIELEVRTLPHALVEVKHVWWYK